MTFFSWRCLPALVVAFGLAAGAKEPSSWSAVFPGADGGSVAAAFAVGDGRYVISVALSGAKANDGHLRLAGRELPAEVFVDPVSRLVVFRMTGPPGQALALMQAAPSAAGVAISSGAGDTGKTTGWIKRVEGKILPLAMLAIDYAGAPPAPGTPLLDASGRVLAVAHQPTGPRSGYALPAEVVKRVLEDVLQSGRVSRGWIGLKLRPEEAMPRVTTVQAGSPSALAGVRAGDVLLEVGSRRVGDYPDAVNAFYFLRPGTPVGIRLKRGGQVIAVSVTPVERGAE